MISILIIDDEEIDFLIHSKLIKKGNFAEKVTYQNSGESALKFLESLPEGSEEWPTHILLDINMPGMSGFQFVENFSKLPHSSVQSTRIFIISSSASPLDQSKAKTYPLIKDYLTKPLTLQVAEKIFTK